MSGKRYSWLKLLGTFFESKTSKAIRKLPNGDTLLLIYLHLQARCLSTNGYFRYEKVEETIEEEIALFLSEDLDMVKSAIEVLKKYNLIEIDEDNNAFLPTTEDLQVGTEAESSARSRECRMRKKKEKLLQCNISATILQQAETNCNIDKEKELEEDIEKELEIDKEEDIEKDTELKLMINKILNENILSYEELKNELYIERFLWAKKYLTYGSIFEIAKNVLEKIPSDFTSRYRQFDREFTKKVAEVVLRG